MTRWRVSIAVILEVFKEVSISGDIVSFGMFIVRGQLRRRLVVDARRLGLRY
jgi:hypothetical protein